MRREPSATLLLIFCVAVLSVALPAAQRSEAERAAERRAREFAEAVSSGNFGAFERYAAANVAPKLLNAVPLQQYFGSLWDTTRALDIRRFENRGSSEVTAMMQARLTEGWLALTIGVEPVPPYRIVNFPVRLVSPALGPRKGRSLTNTEIVRQLTAYLRRLADADVFSGAVLLGKDGGVLFAQAYGEANKDFHVANATTTKFNLGSMNKMFTAVAIAQLVERGKLTFDDPLSRYVPDFLDRAAADRIQIKHLLTHTGGLGTFFTPRYWNSPREQLRTVDDMMRLPAQDEKLRFEPGTRFEYSNTGFLVLGKVIEQVSGRSYYDYVRENIYGPAGMLNSDSYEIDKVNANLAVGYEKVYTSDAISFTNSLLKQLMRGGPHGGGYSTVEDLLKFERALRTNRLLKPERLVCCSRQNRN